jgi:hypothetical protein
MPSRLKAYTNPVSLYWQPLILGQNLEVMRSRRAGFLTIRHTPYGPEWFMVYDLFLYGELNHILPIRQMTSNRSRAHIFL